MSQEIQAIRFDVQDIGKHVKSSKKRFSWTFGLNGRNHTIILDFSFISGKVKLVIDRKTALETELPANSSFQHPFTLDGYAVNILQQGETFQMRINNKVFSHLYNQAKTNTEFRNYEDEVKDIKVNESNFQNTGKTVKLNIGALGGAKQKTRQNAETQNWGNQMSIPSYFGDSQTTQPQKKQVKKNKSLLDEDEQTSAHSAESSQQKKTQQVKTKNSGQVDFFANNQPSVSVSPSQEHLQNIMNQQQANTNKAEDFNTMQNMFATMNISSQVPASQPKQQVSGLDLLNSLDTPQASVNTNPNDFSTMQRLFATNAQNPGLYNIQSLQTGTQVNQAPISGTSGVSNDFNTMQNLFATGVNLGGMQNLGQPYQPISNIQQPTAANFATGSNINNLYPNSGANMAQFQSNSLPMQNVGQLDNNFNTMQNLFATSNNANLGLHNLTSPVQSVQPVQPVSNLQNINLQDFNTMQNLFKTGGAPILPPPQSAGSQSLDLFSALNMPPTTQTTTQKIQITKTTTTNNNMGMFNTYSGNKSSVAPTLDASSFGTMQKGQISNIDFLQSLPTQPQQVQQTQQQMPNFSKKKQPLEQDLI